MFICLRISAPPPGNCLEFPFDRGLSSTSLHLEEISLGQLCRMGNFCSCNYQTTYNLVHNIVAAISSFTTCALETEEAAPPQTAGLELLKGPSVSFDK